MRPHIIPAILIALVAALGLPPMPSSASPARVPQNAVLILRSSVASTLRSLYRVHLIGTVRVQMGRSAAESTISGDVEVENRTLSALLAVQGRALPSRIVQHMARSYVLTQSQGRNRIWSRGAAGNAWVPALPSDADSLFLTSLCPSQLALRLQKGVPPHLSLIGSSGGAVWHLRSLARRDGTIRQEDFVVQRRSFYLMRYALRLQRNGDTTQIDIAYSGFNLPGALTLPHLADPPGRYGAVTVPLAGGQVLVAGGIDLWGRTQTALLFNPDTGLWARTGDMHLARGPVGSSEPAAVRLGDGRVLVVGGAAERDTPPEIYEPASGGWISTNPMDVPRDGCTLTLLPDGRVLAEGGVDRNGHITATAEVFDPRTGTWTKTGAMTAPRRGAAALLLDGGTVLVAGGVGDDIHDVARTAEVYNPDTGRWSAVASMPDPLGDGIHLLRTGSGSVMALGKSLWNLDVVTELYDPASGSWSEGPDSRSVRGDWTPLSLPDGRVLIAGGSLLSDTDRHYHALQTALLFDPAGDSWTQTASMAAPRAAASLVPLPDGRALALGGYTSLDAGRKPEAASDILPSAEIYSDTAARWEGIRGMDATEISVP